MQRDKSVSLSSPVGMPLRRREFFQATTMALAAATTGGLSSQASAQGGKIEAQEHWAKKGSVDLYLYRKRLVGDGSAAKPVLFLVHGSTFSCRGSYDLQVPGRPNYSMMDHFAALGFDVWSMDHEGYGHSSRTGSHAGILVGVEDLRAAMPVVEKVTGRSTVMMYGAVLRRDPGRRLCDGRARIVSSGWSSMPSPTPARMRPRSSAAARWRTSTGPTRAARSAWPPSSASSIATSRARPSRRWLRRLRISS